VILRLAAVVLVPVAVEMIYEKMTGTNLFFIFGGVAAKPAIREGHIRAQGPFAHAILAGTVGAIFLPLMIALWKRHRRYSLAGIAACITMIGMCSSSGPIMSAMAGVGALILWRFRLKMRWVKLLAVLTYLGLEIVMKDPAYYILARIDITGGSTGWHRARLIRSAIAHLDEWWLGGTDYTRHWMPTGVSWSPNHTDLTNHYIKLGVIGGLPLMLLFIATLWVAFSYVGQAIRDDRLQVGSRYMIWAFGASLFSIAATGISVSFFDQSSFLVYLVLSALGAVPFIRAASRDFTPAFQGVPDQNRI
jgi:hypothetical protein